MCWTGHDEWVPPCSESSRISRSRVQRGCLPHGLMLVSGSLAEEISNSLLQVLKSEVLFSSSRQGLPHSVRLLKDFLHFTVFFLYRQKLSYPCTLVDVFPSVHALLLERTVSFLLSLQTRSQCQSPSYKVQSTLTCVIKKECYSLLLHKQWPHSFHGHNSVLCASKIDIKCMRKELMCTLAYKLIKLHS